MAPTTIKRDDVWTICEVVAECQALLDDHVEDNKFNAIEVAEN